MRSLMFLMVLVLVCSVPMTSSAPLALNVAKCCMKFNNVKIPVKQVKSYYWTSSECPKPAIVFQTFKGKEFCIDPETTWVNHHVDNVDKRTPAATTTTTTPITTTAATSSAASTATQQRLATQQSKTSYTVSS
ncbi:C-C motif chemokine 13-like [Pimephales promelas]|uniref:C-C motif chemokine 13-like n=1 Tax=Pimephales promelas TaxID=90988 RepID=UPI001955F0D5|nr:C-C motif chemokine 13-like [Pimephales promelas]